MALSQVWRDRRNVALPDVTTALRYAASVAWALKSSLLDQTTGGDVIPGATPAAGWVLNASSDSVTASAADNLAAGTFTASKWVRNSAGVHSWYSMSHVASGLNMVVDMNGASDASALTFVFSRSAFSGGSTSARPTASNEFYGGSTTNAAVAIGTASPAAGYFHFSENSGGGRFNFVTTKAGTGLATSALCTRDLVQSPLGISDPAPTCVLFGPYADTSRGSPASVGLSAVLQGRTADNAATITTGGFASVTSAGGYAHATSMTTVNQATGQWDLTDIFLDSMVASKMGRRGRVPDMFYSGLAPVLDAYLDPTDSKIYLIVCGVGIWIPFSGTLTA